MWVGVLVQLESDYAHSYPGGIVGSYTIPNGVTAIGDAALITVPTWPPYTIPNTVTSIGGDAFYHCTSLTSVAVPNSVTNIKMSAFNYCSGLTNVTLPASVTNLGDGAFYDCTSLTGIYFLGNAPSLGGPSVFSSQITVRYCLLPAWHHGVGRDLWRSASRAVESTTSESCCANQSIRLHRYRHNQHSNSDNVCCTNPANPTWVPLQTCTLVNGSIYFSDPQWTNYPELVSTAFDHRDEWARNRDDGEQTAPRPRIEAPLSATRARAAIRCYTPRCARSQSRVCPIRSHEAASEEPPHHADCLKRALDRRKNSSPAGTTFPLPNAGFSPSSILSLLWLHHPPAGAGPRSTELPPGSIVPRLFLYCCSIVPLLMAGFPRPPRPSFACFAAFARPASPLPSAAKSWPPPAPFLHFALAALTLWRSGF